MGQAVLSDKELIRAYLSGDEKSFEILLNRNKDRVFGYIMSKVRNENLANDIFQEVFIKVIRTFKNGTYNEEGKFLPWVLTISHNLIVDHFRKAKKMQMVSESSSKSEDFNIFSVLKLMDNNVEDDLIKEQIELDVVRLVEYLPEEQRGVLKDRIFKGMSFKDIAEQEDISINTALGRMRYALINLRKLVDKHNVSITA
ncbi:sigma-70 family RNA polymerase sigma factor [Paracrocinitomix mangrovi]|uniref:RNA polymerase sigma factor n=1 Tax=Paracrocinitomix mangrovi TaxID=2862509 RepID=UPI001C8E1E88|nr:sigma-70 family RNA polymerase sigma factor [Paracrocinitomix mangrovi]UKN02589.1 sigma-70 family RNA polymerase sigma factor [Paracrocinitomix mangrovi]